MGTLKIMLRLTATTPLSVGAAGSAGTLTDKAIVRDGWNRPIIPGSQVKGQVRHTTEMLVRGVHFTHVQHDFDDDTSPANVIRTLFGSPRQRGQLMFADLIGVAGDPAMLSDLCTQPEQHRSQIRPAVTINRRRGVADDARLLFQETTLNRMQFFADPAIQGEVDTLGHAALVWAAVRLTTRWGGATSRGLGWVNGTLAVQWDGDLLTIDDLEPALRDLVAQETNRNDHH
ncbi:MAG: hypothetical protein HC914_15840 [Chloroflexaceae bacterium]|nr:hypothetical protein [Chloroflexaceae bacterium]